MTAADVIAFLEAVAGRVGDAFPVLLGGAGGALLIWWLDGRRVRERERRELIGALELVTLELAANIAQADFWVRPVGAFRAIELRWEAWTAHQATIARSLPRDVVGRVGTGYELARALNHNVEFVRRRGSVQGDQQRMAKRTRDWQQANLTELQRFMRAELGIQFTQEPVATADLDVRSGASRRPADRGES